MSQGLALRTLQALLPLLNNGQDLGINFYGGEPLLEKGLLLSILDRAEQYSKKNQRHFAMTTNGALLDRDFLECISDHPFELTISHDGLWQQETRSGIPHDNTIEHFEELLNAIPTVKAQYSCVCPPSQITRLTDNIAFFKGETQRQVHFGLDSISPWDENAIEALDYELSCIRQSRLHDSCPNFFTPPEPGMFGCSSKERITVDPEGYIWGCFQYFDLFCRYPKAGELDRHRVGHVDMPSKDLKELIARWPACECHEQRQWLAGNEACLFCDQFLYCSQCPVNGAYTTAEIGRLPNWVCKIQRMLNKHRNERTEAGEDKHNPGI